MATKKTYKMDAECSQCGNEQNLLLALPDDWTDAQLREALDDCEHECDECGEIDWSPMPDTAAEVV